MNWTDERTALLKKLWADGLSASQIAAELGGISRNSVIGKVHRLGLGTKGQAASQPRKPKPSRIAGALFSGYRPGRQLPAPRETPAVTPAIDEAPAESFRCTILEIGDGKCRWPIGDPRETAFSFCGCKPFQGLPYCEYHARVAYTPGGLERLGIRPLAAQ